MEGLSVRFSEEAYPDGAREMAIAALRKHTVQSNGVPFEERPFSVLGFKGKEPVGGLIGKVIWNWLYADLVWVEEGFRGRGIGTDLMKAVERRAMQMKLTGIYLWTETWEAPGFYTKLGYTQFVEFKDFPPGHSRLGFLKYLG